MCASNGVEKDGRGGSHWGATVLAVEKRKKCKKNAVIVGGTGRGRRTDSASRLARGMSVEKRTLRGRRHGARLGRSDRERLTSKPDRTNRKVKKCQQGSEQRDWPDSPERGTGNWAGTMEVKESRDWPRSLSISRHLHSSRQAYQRKRVGKGKAVLTGFKKRTAGGKPEGVRQGRLRGGF